MNAIKVARRFTLETDPANESATILAQLVLALESEHRFELVTLYSLGLQKLPSSPWTS